MSTILINTGQSTVEKSVDILVPGTEEVNTLSLPNDDFQPKLAAAGFIDVIHDFSWYAGPKASTAALDKIPCIFLTEREQKISSLISGAIYYMNASKKAVEGQISKLGKGATSLLGKLTEGSEGSEIGIGSMKNTVGRLADAVGEYMQDDTKLLESHNLKSLQGIYLTKETGFKYRLPFFDTEYKVASKWGDQSGSGEDGKGMLQGLIDKGVDFVDTLSRELNVTQPGVYIEKPKYFQHASEGETKTVNFPLLNTINRSNTSQIQQNYELLWLLAFQNKSYKTSFAKSPPPKLYTVAVPGQFSMPYAYISSLSIKFLGTVRRLPVSIPTLANGGSEVTTKTVTVPIPEAYDVTIEFTSLIGDYGNAMVSNAFMTDVTGGKVTSGTSTDIVGQPDFLGTPTSFGNIA
ncbi:hypothetical protein N9Z65_00945 [bacterium]|nr:hypothetical protein [bacterium]